MRAERRPRSRDYPRVTPGMARILLGIRREKELGPFSPWEVPR